MLFFLRRSHTFFIGVVAARFIRCVYLMVVYWLPVTVHQEKLICKVRNSPFCVEWAVKLCSPTS